MWVNVIIQPLFYAPHPQSVSAHYARGIHYPVWTKKRVVFATKQVATTRLVKKTASVSARNVQKRFAENGA